MSPMKVGFIGCGGIARVHLRAVRASNAQLVGVADVFENYARRFAAEECGGNVDVYPSVRELVRHPPSFQSRDRQRPAARRRSPGALLNWWDPYDVESIRSGAERVLRDDRLRQSMIAKGLRRCKDFSWTKTAAATSACLSRC